MSNLTTIGLNSLMAFQQALTVTGQNIANANTPYYSRRMVDFHEMRYNYGVSLGDVRRISDEAINRYDQASTSNLSSMDAYLTELKGFEPLFDNANVSIGKTLTESLSALEKLNANTGSSQNRSLYMGQLSELVNRFHALSSQMNQARANTNAQMQNDVGDVNSLLKKIASINGELSQSTTHLDPDLLDERDASLQELAKYMNFTTLLDSRGVASVTLDNGLALVKDEKAETVQMMADTINSQKLQIGIVDGAKVLPITNYIHSGELIGLMTFQNSTLDQTQHAVDRLAIGISQTFNQQNALGMDANGNLGKNIFSDINNSLAIQNRVMPNASNQGQANLSVSIADVSQLSLSDYKLSIGTGQQYVLTRLSDNKVMSSGTLSSTFPQTLATADGFSTTINTATFAVGDQYIISPTKNGGNHIDLGTQDSSKLALGWPVMASNGVQSPGSAGVIKVTDVISTTTSAFSTPKSLNPLITIQFLTPTSYQLINANNSQVMEGPLSYDPVVGANLFPTPGGYDPGYRVALSGTIQAGDDFKIGYNTNSADNSNGLAMAKLYQKGLFDHGALSWTQGYSSLSNNVSMDTGKAKAAYDSAQIIKAQASSRRDAVSGVALQEETMSLNDYQQYYQASAQILSTAKSVFDIILSMTRS
jgi:flagellar hook-associated protein 1 FlgK